MGVDYRSGPRAEPSPEFASSPRVAHFVARERLAASGLPWNSAAIVGLGG